MALNKVELCGINTSALPTLKNDEMREMLIKIKQGDRQARQDFIHGNLRLVLSIIQRFQGRGDSVDDLFQIGCIGLIKSIDNFDLNQNVRFSTYAVPMTAFCRKRNDPPHISFGTPVIISPRSAAACYERIDKSAVVI